MVYLDAEIDLRFGEKEYEINLLTKVFFDQDNNLTILSYLLNECIISPGEKISNAIQRLKAFEKPITLLIASLISATVSS